MSIATQRKFSVSEINQLLKLLIPLALTGFLEASVGFFSTLFLAHLGTKELAAGAVAQWIFFTVIVVLWGTLSSVSVLISQKYGAKDEKGVAQVLLDGLVLALLVVLPAMLILKNIEPILLFIGQDPTMAAYAKEYMQGMVWVLFPDFVGIVFLQFLIGLGHTRTNMVFSLLWVPLNVFCNYSLVFGKFGFPALGIAGIGWGMALSYWISLVFLLGYILLVPAYRHYVGYILKLRRTRFLGELCHIGIPMGLMFCLEIAFFLTLTLLMGQISVQELAANQITLQFMGQSSVLTFAIAQAVTVRMGHTLGAKEPYLARRAAYIGVGIAMSFMVLVALCCWLIPEKLIGLDLDVTLAKNAEIVLYAKRFLGICALFMLLESIRFVMFGALRSLKDTRFTLLVSVLSFWGIALPIGYWLATRLDFGGSGLWWGIVLGAIVCMTALTTRFHIKMNQQFNKSWWSN